MLFRKKIQKDCVYCQHAKASGKKEILCTKRRNRAVTKPCLRFKYDPCKRIPPRPKAPNFAAYKDGDFTL
ncbi:MAG: hypothetical protein E7461_00720 [Ruminococcaceae bacterium]|nr:hypothetical protein [Oscillospiraceae bacterium]